MSGTRLYRGVEASMPVLADGEPGWCSDSEKLYIGDSGVTHLVKACSYIDRGDPAAWDFITSSFTRDGAWNNLDLSAIVPATCMAHMRIKIQDVAAGSYVSFREDGNSNVLNVAVLYTQVANVVNTADVFCKVYSNKQIEYWATSGIAGVSLVVRGWWL